MSTNHPSAPITLHTLVSQGWCAWYSVDAEELGRVVRATWVAYAQELKDGGEDVPAKHLVPFDELPESDKEVDRRIGMAVVDHLGGYVSGVFGEMEVYAAAMYQTLLFVRSLCGEAGVLVNREAKLQIDLDQVLGLKQPAHFRQLYPRLMRALDKAGELKEAREQLRVLAPDKSAIFAGQLPLTQENMPVIELQTRVSNGITDLLSLLGDLSETVARAGEPQPAKQRPIIVTDSDMISGYFYDEALERLYVEWKQKGKMKAPAYGYYSNVDAALVMMFERADSRGGFIHSVLRENPAYPYEKCEGWPDSAEPPAKTA